MAGVEVSRMAFLMKIDVTPDPVDVRLLGAETIMFETDFVADLVQQAGMIGHDPYTSMC